MTTKKKRVSLDVFEEAVLPTLEQKHKKDAAKIQADIDENYSIYELDDENKETKVKFTVSAPTKAATEDGDEQTEDERIASAVEKALAKFQKPGDRNPLGETGATKKFTVPAECKRYGQLKAFTAKSVGGTDFAPDERAFRFGMWGLAARGNATAKEWCAEHGIGLHEKKFSDELLQKLHSEGTNTAGGYLVPEEFGTDLILLREQYGVARRLCKIVPMASDTRTDPRQTGGLTSYFVGEGAAGTESTMAWDQVRLTAKDLMTLSRMTNQVNADAIINFGDTLAYECAYSSALKEDQCLFLGDATSTYGGITGVRQEADEQVDGGDGRHHHRHHQGVEHHARVAGAGRLRERGRLAPQYADTTNAPCGSATATSTTAVMVKRLLAAGGNTRWRSRTATAARARCSSATRSSSARCSRAPRRRRRCSPCSVISRSRPASATASRTSSASASTPRRRAVGVRAQRGRVRPSSGSTSTSTTSVTAPRPARSSRSPPADRVIDRLFGGLSHSTETRFPMIHLQARNLRCCSARRRPRPPPEARRSTGAARTTRRFASSSRPAPARTAAAASRCSRRLRSDAGDAVRDDHGGPDRAGDDFARGGVLHRPQIARSATARSS
jgi:hypothetical protein